MSPDDALDQAVHVRYFAGAAAAAGVSSETYPSATVGDLLIAITRRHERLHDILPKCSLLVDGVLVSSHETPVSPGATLDVLPPFAGG